MRYEKREAGRGLSARRRPWALASPPKVFLMLAMGASTAAANTSDILIGASLPLSGGNAAVVGEGLAVAKVALETLNASGGIGGRKVQLVVMDDAFEPAKAAANAQTLADKGVVAIFNCWGSASCTAMMPIINAAKLPLITGIAGSGPMRTEPGRYAFSLRASTEQEIAYMVRQMQTVGQSRMAVVYQDDAFGKGGLAAAQTVMGKAGATPIIEKAVARDGSNADAVVDALKAANGNGIVLVASPQATVAVIGTARKNGVATQFYNLAAQANQSVVSGLGDHTTGVVFTTLVPSPWRDSLPAVRDYQRAVQKASGKTDYSYLGFEVYLNAQLLIEGLRQAGPTVTRESLVTALEGMGERSFSPQLRVRYAPNDRSGSNYVGLTIISRGGRFVE